MNESDKKRLTEWLGECWHDSWSQCTKCERYYVKQRDFTSPADFFACYNRLVELGEWEDFSMYASKKWVKRHWANPDIRAVTARFTEWLNSRTESGLYRLCVLVAEWLAQKEGKGDDAHNSD
jgi:hypothetical protein